jgi:hypothetical protein
MCVQAVPTSVRAWFKGLTDRHLAAAVNAYTTAVEADLLIHEEMRAAEALKDSSLAIKASGRAHELVASMEVDEGIHLELLIQLPSNFPLDAAEVSFHCLLL